MSGNAIAAVERFERQGRAAQELWERGYPAECGLLLEQGVRAFLDELGPSHGLPAHLEGEVKHLLEEFRACSPVYGRKDYSREHAAWVERARRLSSDLVDALRHPARGPSRRQRAAVAAGALALTTAVASFYWLHRLPRVHGSAEYSAEFSPKHAADGLVATEWLLPNGQLGTLDISWSARRRVNAIAIVNSHNRQYMDRATRSARVVLFEGQHQVGVAEVSFAKIENAPAPARAPFNGKRGDRVRIEILGFLGAGAGIAEVQIE